MGHSTYRTARLSLLARRRDAVETAMYETRSIPYARRALRVIDRIDATTSGLRSMWASLLQMRDTQADARDAMAAKVAAFADRNLQLERAR